MILKLMRVRGDSLAPRCRAGDYVLVSGLPLRFRAPRPAELVVFDQPEYGRLIKRVEHIEPGGGLFVRGEALDSVDSRRFGAIAPGAVLGVVLLHIPAS